MPSNHLILCCPLLLLPSIFPSIRVFSSESVLCIRWPKYWSFSFSISPSNEYSGLISTGWISLQSNRLSKVFSNTTVLKHSANPWMVKDVILVFTSELGWCNFDSREAFLMCWRQSFRAYETESQTVRLSNLWRGGPVGLSWVQPFLSVCTSTNWSQSSHGCVEIQSTHSHHVACSVTCTDPRAFTLGWTGPA